MKLAEAIKKLRTWGHTEVACPDKDLEAAVQLGIEALEREEFRRKHQLFDKVTLLPGETKE